MNFNCKIDVKEFHLSEPASFPVDSYTFSCTRSHLMILFACMVGNFPQGETKRLPMNVNFSAASVV